MTVTPEEIIRAVASGYGLTADELRSRRRTARMATARHVAAWLLTRRLHLSTVQAGRLLRRHHASVIYGAGKVDDMLTWPAMYAADLAVLRDVQAKFQPQARR